MIFREIKHTDTILIKEYKNSFIKINESIPGAAGLETTEDISQWINEKLLEKSKDTIINKNFVPASTFLLIKDDILIGIINIRHELNEYLLNFGGHIGYSIHPDFRRKGFGKIILNKAIEYSFKDLMNNKLLITCNSSNIASEKTILSCGGILDNIIEETDRMTKRFWIYKKED